MSPDKPLPRISVITPSLNQGRYLRQCIESVLSQDYPNLEFFIVDGGSTDESLSVIQEYGSAISYGLANQTVAKVMPLTRASIVRRANLLRG